MRCLLTVEDTFLIQGRGLIVVPSPRVEAFRGPGTIPVELRLPDGSTATAELTVQSLFISPPPTVFRWACLFRSLAKRDVPIGTQVWCGEELFLGLTQGSKVP